MPYKFTIVDIKTNEPLTGTVRFRSGGGVTPDAWPIGLLGSEVPDAVVESYDSIIVDSPGYGQYATMTSGLYSETEFRLVKDSPVLLFVAIGAAAAGLVVAHYFEKRK